MVTTHQAAEILQMVSISGSHLNLPNVQLYGDQLWLAGARCWYRNGGPENNAELYNLEGKLQRSGCLGDGIEWIRQTPSGNLWVGYFDEGVGGNNGWGDGYDGHKYVEPLGSNGIVLWDDNFNKLYEPQCQRTIWDAYAGTLSDDDLWASTYIEFPIHRFNYHVSDDGLVSSSSAEWSTSDSGVRALITDQRFVATIGEYGESLCLSTLAPG
jgi:hypothetical protein